MSTNALNQMMVISSKDKTSPNQSSNSFTVNFNPPFKVKRYQLAKIQIPNDIYNVNSTNNIIKFNDGTANRTATVTVGAYDSSTISAAIKSAMDAASGVVTYTVTFSVTTYKFTIVQSAALLTMRGSDSGFTMASFLGFSSTTNTAAAATQISTNGCNLLGYDNIFINIQELSSFVRTPSNIYTFVIPLNASAGNLIIYSVNHDFGFIADIGSVTSIQTMNIVVRDRLGNLIDFNNVDWTLYINYSEN